MTQFGWDLPPGVTDNMLPGNQDVVYECCMNCEKEDCLEPRDCPEWNKEDSEYRKLIDELEFV